jgi:hypothetical protein
MRLFEGRTSTRRAALLLVAALAGIAVCLGSTLGRADEAAAPIFVMKAPAGYRDWKLISVAHEEGNLNSFAAVLGNEVAIKAYRDGKLPFPDGAIIAALHYMHVSSEENNKVFGRAQSFVPGTPTNIQFMVKDAKKYAATGGWGFGHFNNDGTLGDDVMMKTCFPATRRPRVVTLSSRVTHPKESFLAKSHYSA